MTRILSLAGGVALGVLACLTPAFAQQQVVIVGGSAVLGGAGGDISVSLDDIETNSDAMVTSLQLLDDAVSGSGINISAIGGVAPTPDMTADFESDGDTQTRSIIGLAVPSAAGAVVINGTTGEGLEVQGSVAHDAVDAGNPDLTGYRAIAFGANPTAVAAADRTVGYANRAGVPFTLGGHMNVVTKSWQIQDADNAQDDLALVTCGAGCIVVVTQIDVSCDMDTTAETNAYIGFGTANTPTPAETGVTGLVFAFTGIVPGGGKTRGDGTGIIGVGTDGQDLRLDMEDPAGGACDVTTSYFTIES